MKTGINKDGTLQPQTTQTRYEGTHDQRYECYLALADDGTGHEIGTGRPMKSFDEWMNS